jgi:hypothetical protein
MPLPTSDLLDWIRALGWDDREEYGAPLRRGPRIRKMPDRLVTFSPTPGAGYMLEAAADAGGFQARVRGAQNDEDDAERLAYKLDALILGASFPAVTASGQTIVHIHRLGGAPSPLSADPDDADRYSYICQYLCIAGVPPS